MWQFIKSFFSPTYVVQCPDGSNHTLHRKIDDLFPLTVRDTATKLNTEVSAAGAFEGKAAAEFASVIKGMMFSIDDSSAALIIEQRAAYTVYVSNPCQSHAWYMRQIEDISARRNSLQQRKELLATLVALANSPNAEKSNIIGLLGKLADRLSPEAALLVTVEEMDKAEEVAIEMRGEENK